MTEMIDAEKIIIFYIYIDLSAEVHPCFHLHSETATETGRGSKKHRDNERQRRTQTDKQER